MKKIIKIKSFLLLVIASFVIFSSSYSYVNAQEDDDGVIIPVEPGGGEEETNYFIIDTFIPRDFASNGILSFIGYLAQLAVGLMVIAWIAIILLAAIKIIQSQGNPEGIEGGMKRIRNVFIGITIGILFFVAVSVIGRIAGIGDVFQWGDNLAECECPVGASQCNRFKFQAEAKVQDGQYSECRDGSGWVVLDGVDQN